MKSYILKIIIIIIIIFSQDIYKEIFLPLFFSSRTNMLFPM